MTRCRNPHENLWEIVIDLLYANDRSAAVLSDQYKVIYFYLLTNLNNNKKIKIRPKTQENVCTTVRDLLKDYTW